MEIEQIKEYQVFKDFGKAVYEKNKITNAPEGHQKIRVHFVFDVKHCGKFKARLVADGHLTKEPMETVYSGVVSIRNLRLAMFLAELNNLELWGADVGNAYLQALAREKLYIVGGPEFEELQGHVLVMYKALYGTRSGGACWHDKCFDILHHMGFKPSRADPDIWMKSSKDASHYEYIAVYVDDLAICMKDPSFWEPIYYKMDESEPDHRFPSQSNEKRGHWVGFAENKGDQLTWKILTDDTNTIIIRSAVRSATKTSPNLRLDPAQGEDQPQDLTSDVFAYGRPNPDGSDNTPPMSIINFDDLLGRTFLLPMDENGERKRATISEHVKDLYQQQVSRENQLRFKLKIDEDQLDDLISYNQLMEYLEDKTDTVPLEDGLYRFTCIKDHKGPYTSSDPEYNGSSYNLLIEWETGEQTWEPLSNIIASDPYTCAVYAKEHNLLNTPGWKLLKRHARTARRLIRTLKKSKYRQARASRKYKHGWEVPRDYAHALQLDIHNGNNKWKEAIDLEIEQIKEYQVFKDFGKAVYEKNKITNAPEGHQKIRVHFVFDVKHCGKFKARLVADGHLTKEPMETVYSGVVSIRNLRLAMFLAELNNLELWGADVGNAYLQALAREKLYIVGGPEFEELQGHVLVMYKALYGTRSGGACWHDKCFDILHHMGFKPSRADPDIWMKSSKDASHYEYITVYVDDLAICMKDPSFWEPIYYKMDESEPDHRFPSQSNEKRGHWVGFAENKGDQLTWKILTDDTNTIIIRSAVRSATKTSPNLRLDPAQGEDQPQDLTSDVFVYGRPNPDGSDNTPPMSIINFDDLLGRTFLLPMDENGERKRATISEHVKDLYQQQVSRENQLRFKLKIDEDQLDDLISYNQLMEYLEDKTDTGPLEDGLYRFTCIKDHKGPYTSSDPEYNGSSYNLLIEWETGEQTWEPLSNIIASDPNTCAVYAKEHNLLNTPGWKLLKRHARTARRLIRTLKTSKYRQARASRKHKHGWEVPRDYPFVTHSKKSTNSN